MTTLPTDYPYLRSWSLNDCTIERYLALTGNWERSQKNFEKLRRILLDAKLPAQVRCVAAAGSLGRMEASEESDADLIIILDEAVKDPAEAQRLFESVWQSLDKAQIPRPKPEGVFSQPCTLSQICGNSLGSAGEPLGVFGKRLLLILETQPLYQDEEYENIINSIVTQYARHYVASDARKEWAFMMNDLMRYFRALCVNYQWDFENDPIKWPIRNVKLRHSRLIMYSGLLFLLGEASKERVDKVTWLRERLRLTPLERLGWVYGENHDWNFHRIVGLYNVFLSRINSPDVRKSLRPEVNDTYIERFRNELYAELKANSDGLIAELLRFVFARRGAWSERFYEYLIF